MKKIGKKMIKKFALFEKMSINTDVKSVSDMIISKIEKSPEVNHLEFNNLKFLNKYKINKIIVDRDDDIPHMGYFNRAKSGKNIINDSDGYCLRIKIKKTFSTSDPKNTLLSIIYHEVQHAVDFVIKQEKNVKEPKINYGLLNQKFDPSNKFSGIKKMLYMAYDTEMKSRLHDIYISFKYYLDKNKITKPTNKDINNFINKSNEENKVYWVCYKKMIEYDILSNIKNNDDDLKKIIKYISIVSNEDDGHKISTDNNFNKIEAIKKLKKIEKYIHDQGLKYKNKAHKILFAVVDEYNNI